METQQVDPEAKPVLRTPEAAPAHRGLRPEFSWETSESLSALSKAVKKATIDPFAISGILDARDLPLKDMKLFYQGIDKFSFPPEEAAIERLFERCCPTLRRSAQQTESPTYQPGRRHIRASEFSISPDPVAASKLMDIVRRAAGLPWELEARSTSLYVDGAGSETRSRWCAKKDNENWVGRLIVSLPTGSSGRQHIVKHGSGEYTMLEASESTKERPTVPWVFHFGEVSFETGPVVQGHHITLNYDVCKTTSRRPSSLSAATREQHDMTDSRFLHWTELFTQLGESFDQRRVLGFGLKHKYDFSSIHEKGDASERSKRLRGVDRLLMDVIEDQGLSWEFRDTLTAPATAWKKYDREAIADSIMMRDGLNEAIREWSQEETKLEVTILDDNDQSQEWIKRMDQHQIDRAKRYLEKREKVTREIEEDLLDDIKDHWQLPYRYRAVNSRLGVIPPKTLESISTEGDGAESVIKNLIQKGGDDGETILWMTKPQHYAQACDDDDENPTAATVHRGLAIFVVVEPLESESSNEEDDATIVDDDEVVAGNTDEPAEKAEVEEPIESVDPLDIVEWEEEIEEAPLPSLDNLVLASHDSRVKRKAQDELEEESAANKRTKDVPGGTLYTRSALPSMEPRMTGMFRSN